MPIGNIKKIEDLIQYYYNSKIITPLETLNLIMIRHFPKLRIAYFNGKIPFPFLLS